MKTYLAINSILILIIVGLCSGSKKQETLVPSEKKHALLIGINDYRDINVAKLEGCVNDVNLMKGLLNRRGFPNKNIITLLNDQASKGNIIQSFKKVIGSVNNGDIVVIHFSGHGSQVEDDVSNEEVDGLDETLIPHDYVHTEERARKTSITDDELDGLLNQLTGKTAKVTLTIDACHSGGVTRNLKSLSGDDDSTARYIPIVDAPAASNRNLQIDNQSGFGPKAAKYVLVTGCRSDQKVRETLVKGKFYGILTSSLYKTLENTGGVQTWPDIIQKVREEVKIITKTVEQTPQLEGDNADSYVFGENVKLDKQFVFVSKEPDNTITVHAGEVLGMTAGSVFKVYSYGTIDFSTSGSIAQIEITKTNSTTSKAKVISGKVNGKHFKAREFKHNFSGSTLNIAFAGNWQSNFMQNIKSAIMSVNSVKEDNRNPSLILNAKNKFIFICFGNDINHTLKKVSTADPELKSVLENEVKRWRKWFHVFRISNPGSGINISVEIEKKPSDLGSSRSIERIKKPDYFFNDSDEVLLRIKNLSRVSIFINIIFLSDAGIIKSFTLGEMLHHPSNDAIDPDKEVKVDNLILTVRGDMQKNIDILKVFATTTDINFEFIEQDKPITPKAPIQELVGREIVVSSKVPVEDWCSLEKVILVKRQ